MCKCIGFQTLWNQNISMKICSQVQNVCQKIYLPSTCEWLRTWPTFEETEHKYLCQLKFNYKSNIKNLLQPLHFVKSVQVWSYFQSVFSCIRTESGEIFRISPRFQITSCFHVQCFNNTQACIQIIHTLLVCLLHKRRKPKNDSYNIITSIWHARSQ